MIVIAGTVSSCDAAHAFSISESQQEYDDRLDFESIKQEVCDALSCPHTSLHIDTIN
jgi:hypothetical protein